MINDAPDDIQSDVLQQAEQKLESQLLPQVRKDYDKIVTAGLATALHNGPNSIAAALKQSQDPITDIVKGAINIVGVLGMQSRGTMPIKAAVPACMTLIIHGLALAQKAGMIQGDAADLSKAGRLYGQMITQKFGLSTQMIQTAATNLHKLTQDPANMDKLRQAGGFTQAPNAGGTAQAPTEDMGANGNG